MKRNVALLPLLVLSLVSCDLLGGSGPGPEVDEPLVSSVSPADGADKVSVDRNISATLTLPNGDLNETTVSDQTVTLRADGADIPVLATPSVSDNTLTLTPEGSLAFSTRYTFSVSSAVKDTSGASFEAFTSTFTTAAEDETPVSGPLEPSAAPLIFETQNNGTSEPQTLTLTNADSEAFTLTSLAPGSGQFTLANEPSLPTDIAPGDSVEVTVTFEPTELGPQITTLNINGLASEIGLRGLSVVGNGGDNEPSLQWIFDTFGLAVDTGDDDDSTTPITNVPDGDEEARSGLNNALGDERIIQRFQKAGLGDVTVEVLAAYGVNNTPVAEFGWYEAGDADARNKLFDVTNGVENAQTLNPDTDGPLSFDPGSASFGFYSFWPKNDFFGQRYVYTQDILNTFSDAIPHHVRAYPLPGESNAYVLATEEFTQGYDYNDIVVIVRNVMPSSEATSCNQVEPIISNRPASVTRGSLELQNLTGAPFGDRLVFSRINNISGNFGDRIEPFTELKCHTLNVLRLSNTGSSTVTVSNLTITGESSDAFVLRNGGSGFSIGVSQSEDLTVEFVETEGDRGIREATLQMQVGGETVEVELAGIFQTAPEGGREEYLGRVVEAFGYSTDMGTNSRGAITSAASPDDDDFTGPAGDEVISKFWQRANGSAPIHIRQLAAFHSCCSSSSNDDLRVIVDGTILERFEHAEVYGQSVLPPVQGSDTAAAEMTVSPGGPFELVVRNSYSTNWVTGSRNNGNLGVRFWPAERNDTVIPNTYIVAQDFVENGCGTSDTANCDFNDNMYLITNVEPAEAE